MWLMRPRILAHNVCHPEFKALYLILSLFHCRYNSHNCFCFMLVLLCREIQLRLRFNNSPNEHRYVHIWGDSIPFILRVCLVWCRHLLCCTSTFQVFFPSVLVLYCVPHLWRSISIWIQENKWNLATYIRYLCNSGLIWAITCHWCYSKCEHTRNRKDKTTNSPFVTKQI